MRLVSGIWAAEPERVWEGVEDAARCGGCRKIDRSLGDSGRETSCVVLDETGRAVLVQPFHCVNVCVLRRLKQVQVHEQV